MKKPKTAKNDREQITVNGDDIDSAYPVYFNGRLVAYQLHSQGQKANDPKLRLDVSVVNKLVTDYLKGKKFVAKKAVKYYYLEGEQA